MARLPPKPSSLSVEKATLEEIKLGQAKRFAQNFAYEKKNVEKQAEKIKPKAKLLKPAKISDPAWKAIQKQKKKSEKAFTLTELIDTALKNNPQTRQSWENVRVARAVEKQAESELYPQLTISERITKEKQFSSSSLGSLPKKIDDTYYGPSAELTYLLLDFGGRSGRVESTFQKILEANSLYDQSLQDLILNVQTAYYNYYSAQSQVQAAGLDVENTKSDYDAAQQRFDVGLVPKLDLMQAKANYENSLYKFEDAKGNLKNAKANLTLVIGVPADTDIDIAAPAKELPTNIDEDNVSRLIEESIRKRPDVSAIRAELNSKKAAAKAALSDVLPDLNLGLNAQQTTSRYHKPAGVKNDEHDYSGFLSVDWDVFDGFNNWNKKKQADYEANIALDNLIQAELEASSDVWVKYYNFITAVQKLKYSSSFFDTSKISYDLALESYKAGLKSILDLLQAQSNLSQARSQFIQSRQDVFVAVAGLAHSTGTPNIKINSAQKSYRVKGD